MISIPTLSFCITCKNRFHQVSKTLRKNLDDNRVNQEWIEFILVDFGSTDGLHDWITTSFAKDLKSGYLKYYYTDELPYWHMSIAKNTAHWCASNDVIVNLDCDNFTGYLGGQFIIRKFLGDCNIVCHQFSGDTYDGSFGRVSLLKKYFDFVGGYDESFEPIGFEDIDIINRLWSFGLKYCLLKNRKYCAAISNSKEESMVNTNSSHTCSEMDNLNRIKSYKNINEGHLIANNGVYGIRRNLIDNKGRLFYGKSFSSVSSCSYHFYPKSTLRNKVYSETIKVLLEHIAKYSGLLSTLGLFDGKIGVAILIYNGSRYFRSPLLAKIADALIDDITEEIQHITSCGFTTGLSGIAWGINNLNDNGFIELDSDYFNDIDRILFCDEEITEGPDKAEYSFLGLYILSRYEGSSDKSYWITQGDIYCAQMLKLLESKQDLFTHNPSILIPFLYFLLKWREYSIPFINLKAFLNVFRNLNKFILSDKHTINYAFANHLYYRLSEQYASIQLPETLTITDINTVYFNQLLYPDILLFPEKILSDSISIIIDKKPQKELLLFLNSETVGLSRYISGFAWSLLQFTKRFESK